MKTLPPWHAPSSSPVSPPSLGLCTETLCSEEERFTRTEQTASKTDMLPGLVVVFTDNPNFTAKKLFPVLIQLSKASFLITVYWKRLLIEGFQNRNEPTIRQRLTMAWLNNLPEADTCIWPTLCNHSIWIFHFIACLFVYLITGALERSTFSSGDWFKGFLLLGTNYDRAWLYHLSSRHPPTLCEKWRQQRFNSTFCTALWGQIHTTTEQ